MTLAALPAVQGGGGARAESGGRACASVGLPAVASAAGEAKADDTHERAAQHLLAQARLDIAIGRIEDGCRLLGVVAATFAGTLASGAALRELGSAPGDAAASLSAVSEQAGGSAAAALGTAPMAGWREIVVRATGAQDELRDAVGDRIFFAAGSAQIGARAADALAAQAGWLAKHGGFDVVIEGHADDGLGAEATDALARERAEAVRRVLIENGLVATRVGVLALGSADPIAPCSEPQCLVQNRRVVTRLVPAARDVALRDVVR